MQKTSELLPKAHYVSLAVDGVQICDSCGAVVRDARHEMAEGEDPRALFFPPGWVTVAGAATSAGLDLRAIPCTQREQ